MNTTQVFGVPRSDNPPRSSVLANTPTAHGSVGTFVVCWQNNPESFGSAITYVKDLVNGDYFQINRDGVYTIDSCLLSNGSQFYGVTLNTSAFDQQRDVFGFYITGPVLLTFSVQTLNNTLAASCTRPLKAGDRLRMQDESNVFSTTTAVSYMRVTQVSV